MTDYSKLYENFSIYWHYSCPNDDGIVAIAKFVCDNDLPDWTRKYLRDCIRERRTLPREL